MHDIVIKSQTVIKGVKMNGGGGGDVSIFESF